VSVWGKLMSVQHDHIQKQDKTTSGQDLEPGLFMNL
jgi:hypothetical protein